MPPSPSTRVTRYRPIRCTVDGFIRRKNSMLRRESAIIAASMAPRALRFILSSAAAVTGGAALSTLLLAQTPAPQEKAKPVFVDGQAQIVPAFEDPTMWVKQKLWVEAEFDSDGDGRKDRLFVDVTRPKQTETEG